jgi:integrase
MATVTRRVGQTGRVTWQAKVRPLGEMPRSRTFARKTDAEAWAKAVETDLARGLIVPNTADRRRTVAALIDQYLVDALPRTATAKAYRRQLEWWRAKLGALSVEKLTPAAIADARALLMRPTASGKRRKPATVNRYLAALSAACKWAWKERRWLPRNPVLDIAKGRESPGVVRFLTEPERAALMTAARASGDPNIYTALVLALATGARYANIRFLQVDDFAPDLAAARFKTTKNGQGRWVPLIPAAQAQVAHHLEQHPTGAGWLFVGWRNDAPADLDKAWRKVRAAAALIEPTLANFRWHDLRHTTATYLLEAGASTIEIAAALGHKTLAMAQRYAHQSPAFARETFNRLADRLGDAATDAGGTGEAAPTRT